MSSEKVSVGDEPSPDAARVTLRGPWKDAEGTPGYRTVPEWAIDRFEAAIRTPLEADLQRVVDERADIEMRAVERITALEAERDRLMEALMPVLELAEARAEEYDSWGAVNTLRALLADHPTKNLERRGTLDG